MPFGSFACVGQMAKPQPCFAVSTASFTPRAFIDTAQLSVSRAVGANEDGFCDSFQLDASHPGSPFLKKVAILKWTSAIISPFCHASCSGVGSGNPAATAAAAPTAAAAAPGRPPIAQQRLACTNVYR